MKIKPKLEATYKHLRFRAGSLIFSSLFFKQYRQSARLLLDMKDKYNGERCFIVGTGPSLNNTDLSLIEGEFIFGVNTLYTGFDSLGVKPSVYVVGDDTVIRKHYKQILSVDCQKFIVGYAGRFILRNSIPYDNETVFVKPFPFKHNFSCDLTQGIYQGGGVVCLSLQIAYYLGFKEVYLLGCDCDYSGLHRFDGLKAERIGGLSAGDPTYHFSFLSLAKKYFEEDGRTIFNSTVGGKLEVFERRLLGDII